MFWNLCKILIKSFLHWSMIGIFNPNWIEGCNICYVINQNRSFVKLCWFYKSWANRHPVDSEANLWNNQPGAYSYSVMKSTEKFHVDNLVYWFELFQLFRFQNEEKNALLTATTKMRVQIEKTHSCATSHKFSTAKSRNITIFQWDKLLHLSYLHISQKFNKRHDYNSKWLVQ